MMYICRPLEVNDVNILHQVTIHCPLRLDGLDAIDACRIETDKHFINLAMASIGRQPVIQRFDELVMDIAWTLA